MEKITTAVKINFVFHVNKIWDFIKFTNFVISIIISQLCSPKQNECQLIIALVFSFFIISNLGEFFILIKGLLGLTPLQLGSYRIIISSIFIFGIGYKTLREISKHNGNGLQYQVFRNIFFLLFCSLLPKLKL